MEPINNNELTGADLNGTKKAYHTPVVKIFGSLSELTQFSPQRGSDGNLQLDCTLS